MKRTIDQVSSGATSNESTDNNDMDSTSSRAFLLVHQNKELQKELMKNKRTIGEARKELELMRRKAREMESLVSLIQRAWSQLDIDSCMLLDSLGDSEVKISDEGSNELLQRLIGSMATPRFMRVDPTNFDDIPPLNVDQWSSVDDVEKEKNRLLAHIESTASDTSKSDKELYNNEGDDQQVQEYPFGGRIDENLAAHVTFTLSLLERLCNAINETGAVNFDVDAANLMVEMRDLRAEKLMLTDRIIKLTSEVIQLRSRLVLVENDKLKLERNQDRSLVASREAELLQVEGAIDAATSASQASAKLPSSPLMASSSSTGSERELRRQVTLLEEQLAESESAKAQVEMILTERLARPLPQTDVQVSDMRNAMEELRLQCKQKVTSLIAEGEGLQEKARDLELALMELEATSVARIQEVVQLTAKEIAAVKAERDALKTALSSCNADTIMADHMRKQLADYESIKELCDHEMGSLQGQVRMLTETNHILRVHLEKTRSRESNMELLLVDRDVALRGGGGAEVNEGVITSSSSTLEATNGVGGSLTGACFQADGVTPLSDNSAVAVKRSDGTMDPTSQLIVKQSQERVEDLQRELVDARSNIDDLILEIETVVADENKARHQCFELLKQVTEYQTMQRIALEENLHLQDSIDDLKKGYKDIETKMELIKAVMVQQEALINQLKSTEQSVRTNYQSMKKSSMDVQNRKISDEEKLLYTQQILKDTEHSIHKSMQRNQELLDRCNELTTSNMNERKVRMDLQKELSKIVKANKKADRSVPSAESEGVASKKRSKEESDMLDMALNMLRCSVCKDRFKAVAITRCYHLFCKECIDENLKNRLRKCPACGEKFGQDDVTTIYFN